jgi:hypothetical protein
VCWLAAEPLPAAGGWLGFCVKLSLIFVGMVGTITGELITAGYKYDRVKAMKWISLTLYRWN